jgi:hypothetical protein
MELSRVEAMGTTITWFTRPYQHTKTSVHLPQVGLIGPTISLKARPGSTYVDLSTDLPKLTTIDITSIQIAKPVDTSKAVQLLEAFQGLTSLALFTTLLEDQQSIHEQLEQISNQLADILDRMDWGNKKHKE